MDREEEKRRAIFRAFKSIVRVEGEELLLDGKVSARLKRQAVERGFTKSGGRLLRSLSPLERMVMRMRHANTGDSFNHEWWAEWAFAPHWFKKFHEVFLEDWLFYPVEGVALDTREVGRKIGYELEYKRRKFERASADPQFIEQWKLAEFGPPEPPELPPELKGEKIVYTYLIGAYFTDWREYSLESLRKLRPLQQRIYRLAVRLEGDYPAFIKAMGEGAERAQGIDLDRDLTGNEERDHILRILERNFEVISQMRNRKEVADFILERLPVSVDRREFLKQPAQFRAFTERLRNTYFSKIDLRLAARGGPRKSEKSEPRRSRILLYTPEISSGSETQPE